MNAELLSFNTILSPWGHTEETRVYSTNRGEITVSNRYTIGDTDRFERWEEIQEEFRVKLESEYERREGEECYDPVPG